MSRDLVFLALAMLTWGVGESGFLYFQPLVLQQFGASPLVIGSIIGAVGLVGTLAHIPAGYLTDRIGRRPFIWAAWFIGLGSSWIMALAKTLPVFTAGMLVYFSSFFVMSPMMSYATAASGKWSPARAITVISASFNLGAIAGPILGGLVGERFGLQRIYIMAGCIYILSTILILMLRPQPVEQIPEAEKANGFRISGRYWRYMLIVFASMLAMFLPQALSSNYLQNEQGLSIEQIGQLGSISSLGVVVLNLAFGHLAPRWGLLVGQVAMGLFALFLWRGAGIAWYALGYFLLGGYKTARAMATAGARDLVHASRMGLAYGVTESVSASATILAPPVAGLLYSIRPNLPYPASLGLILIAIALVLVFWPRLPEPETTPELIRE